MAGTTTYFGISYPTATDYVKDGASAMQTIATGFDSAVAIPTYNNQTGTTYTFVLADAAKVVSSNNASGVTFTIPPQSSVAWAAGTTLTVTNLGAGTLTIAGGGGVTVTNSASTIAQYGSASIIRTASDAWTVIPFAGGAALLSDSAITGTTGSPTTYTYAISGVNYKTYVFTGSGSITLGRAGLVDTLLIGGGARGASWSSGNPNGGGAAAYIENQIFLPAGTYTCTVGAGNGGLSSIGIATNSFRTLAMGSTTRDAANGFSASFGFSGGANATNAGGGGGGNTAAGTNATSSGTNPPYNGGNGGAGINSSFATGTTTGYCGGGGGVGITNAGTGATAFGGVNGLAGSSGTNTNHAPANRGGGGGGGWDGGSNGGSGLVVVRVKA